MDQAEKIAEMQINSRGKNDLQVIFIFGEHRLPFLPTLDTCSMTSSFHDGKAKGTDMRT